MSKGIKCAREQLFALKKSAKFPEQENSTSSFAHESQDIMKT